MILKGGDTRLKKAASTIAAMKPNQFNNGAVGGQYFPRDYILVLW